MSKEKSLTNRWPKIIKQLEKLNRLSVGVGYFSEDGNAQLLIIARANEYGAHIQPKNGQWLTIPTKDTPTGSDGGPMSPHEIKGLFRPGDKHVLAVNQGGQLTIMYYLVKDVTIPARPFIRTAMIENQKKYEQQIIHGIDSIIAGENTAHSLMKKIGLKAEADIKLQMVSWSKPGNAPATIDLKHGANNPLVNKGILSRAVTSMVMEGWDG